MLLISILRLERKIKNNCLITKESRGIVSQYNVPLCRMMHRVGQIAKRVSESKSIIQQMPIRTYTGVRPKDPEDPFSAKHTGVANDDRTLLYGHLTTKGPKDGFRENIKIGEKQYNGRKRAQWFAPTNPPKKIKPNDYTIDKEATMALKSPETESKLDDFTKK